MDLVFMLIRACLAWCGRRKKTLLPPSQKKAKLLRLAWLYPGRVRTCAVTKQGSSVITYYNLHPSLPSITSCWAFPFFSFPPSGAVAHEQRGITVVTVPLQAELCVSLLSMKRLWRFLNPERKLNKKRWFRTDLCVFESVWKQILCDILLFFHFSELLRFHTWLQCSVKSVNALFQFCVFVFSCILGLFPNLNYGWLKVWSMRCTFRWSSLTNY